MSKEFVRNIKNTKLRGQDKEPLYTNIQNDLLSDDEDVFVRNKDEYHALTDNIKSISAKSDLLTVNKTGKNTRQLVLADDKIALKSELAETNRRVSKAESDILNLIQVQEEIESILEEHGTTIEELKEKQEEIELSEEEKEKLNDLIQRLIYVEENIIDIQNDYEELLITINTELVNLIEEALQNATDEVNYTYMTLPNQNYQGEEPSFLTVNDNDTIELIIEPENKTLYLSWESSDRIIDYSELTHRIIAVIDNVIVNFYFSTSKDNEIYYDPMNEGRTLSQINLDNLNSVRNVYLTYEE